MTDHHDLTAAAHQLGALIDTEAHDLVRRAREAGVALDLSDIKIIDGERTIDGMPADQWLDAMAESDTYSAQWTSPTKTNGEWRDVVTRTDYTTAKKAYADKGRDRLHSRLIVHTPGQEDYTLEEQGPFNGPALPADRR